MNRKTLPITVAAALVLSACTAMPAADLQTAGITGSIATTDVPEDAYRHVVRGARNCFSRFYDVTADYFPQRQSGTVTIAMKSGIAMSAAAVAEIRPSGTGAMVDVARHPSATAMTETIRSWVNGNYSVCDLAK